MSAVQLSAADAAADVVAERLFTSSLAAAEMLAVYLGDRLGWYDALVQHGPVTPGELAGRTGTDARYAQEWLEQQAVAGLLTVADGRDDDPTERRFALPPGAAEVLTDRESLSYLAPLARFLAGVAGQLPALVAAYRTGGGVTWAQFGPDVREAQADMNRPWLERALPGALQALPQVDAVLRRPSARVADIGCGAGWSSIAIARAYAGVSVDGFDADLPSVELAHANAAASGLHSRVRFLAADAAGLAEHGRYDAVFAFECLHDLPHPVDVLAAAREALAPGGVVVVMDEAVGETFAAPADDLERMMYGFSVLTCLPDSMAHRPTAATGTVMRPETLRRYALQAGFSAVEVLPVRDFGFWRFYQLRV